MASSPADQALTLIAFRQARRRTFNERLAEIEFAPEAMLYRCECGLVACETAIKLTGLDYMGLRANPRRFAVFGEHAIPEAEEVVATRGGWSIVEKVPGPGRRLRRRDAHAVRGGRAVDRLHDVADRRRFYAEDYDEDVRLTRSPHGRLEFARTRRAAGAACCPRRPRGCSTWAAGRASTRAGWPRPATSHAVDLMPEHVEQAAAIAGVRASVGDARSLDARRRQFDVVLLLGPLYHLVEAADRRRRCARRRGWPGRAPWSPPPRSAATRACSTSARTPGSRGDRAARARDARDRPPRPAARLHHRLPAPPRGAARRVGRRGPARRRGLRRRGTRRAGAGRARDRADRRVPASRRCAARGSPSATRR